MFKEIEKALQLAAKERLRLEHQLSTSPPVVSLHIFFSLLFFVQGIDVMLMLKF